jgi:hypothetical protein
MQLYFKGLTFQFCVGRLGDEENRVVACSHMSLEEWMGKKEWSKRYS